jgi:hypothetical protein
MATYKLHKWSVKTDTDPYIAPECRSTRLVGYRDEETEHRVVTGPIVKVDGTTITTYSGSVYLLQEIDPNYKVWLDDHGHIYDPENPIKDKRL